MPPSLPRRTHVRRTTAGLISLALVAGGAAAVAAPAASAAPPEGPAVAPQAQPIQDELPNPLEDKRRALRETALTAVLNGEATPEKRGKGTVVSVDQGSRAAYLAPPSILP